MGQQPSKQSVILFHQAVRNGNLEKVKELLQQSMTLEDQDDVFGTPLHEAIAFGRYEIAEILIQHKADVNSIVKNGSDTALCVSAKKGLLNFVELLVTSHAKVNQVGSLSRTPLHWALDNNHEHVAAYLLEHNANPNSLDANGCSPLHIACKKLCYKSIEPLLCKSTLTIDTLDKHHMSPLMYACQAKELKMVEMLLKYKARVRYGNNVPTPLHVVHSIDCAKMIIEAGGDTNARDETYSTPLHHASGVINNFELVELLIAHKADVNARDKNLSTPLHRACAGGALKNVVLLLHHGADVNAVDDRGSSPLHIASRLGYSAISKTLVDYNANPHLANGEGYTPIQLAMWAED